MIVRTKVDVLYNVGVQGTATGIVNGSLGGVVWNEDFNQIQANYSYYIIDDLGDAVIILQTAFTISNEDIDNLYNAIKGSIPPNLEERENTRYKFYLAMVFQMAQTFQIPITDVELVV